ncbi:MAG: hypothetical protein ABSF56_00650 [Minisyncoccia bacterium]|jgi:hypothetical protein
MKTVNGKDPSTTTAPKNGRDHGLRGTVLLPVTGRRAITLISIPADLLSRPSFRRLVHEIR